MTYKEIVKALRCCAKGLGHDDACENCKVGEIQDRREYVEFAAANVIERLTAENAALKDFEASNAHNPYWTPTRVKTLLIRQPAADVAEVVRCRDCKYLVNATINANGFLVCDISDMEIAPDDFCSRGATE